MGIFLSIIALSVLILAHEFGHLITSKIFGIHVETFALGMGKPFIKVKLGSTDYGIAPFPLGGYCKLKGEGNKEVEEDESLASAPDSYAAAKTWKKIIVLLSGSAMNLLLAFVVLIILSLVFINIPLNDAIASKVIADSPAQKAGIIEGDLFVAYIDPKTNKREEIQDFDEFTSLKSVGVTDYIIKRNNSEIKLNIVPEKIEIDEGKYSSIIGVVRPQRHATFSESIKSASWFFIDAIKMMYTGLKDLFGSTFGSLSEKMVGPIGIVTVTGDVANAAIQESSSKTKSVASVTGNSNKTADFFYIWAVISINLGIMNLLPIPPLDGGKIVEELVKPLTNKVPIVLKGFKAISNLATFALLGLMIFVYGNDIFRYILKPIAELFV